jgi:RimJ/RimL family protein N-acetyltransferase
MGVSFQGNLVELSAEDPEVLAKAFTRWNLDTEYFRLLDSEPPRLFSEKKIKEWFEKDLENDPKDDFFFSIKHKESGQVIGFIGLFDLHWNHGDTLIVIAIGERDHWGKGYGTEAMRILLSYIFDEMNLRRASLLVFDYNGRAQRMYEKSGFVVEGRVRRMMQREGRRWDWLYMGILKEEWQRQEKEG